MIRKQVSLIVITGTLLCGITSSPAQAQPEIEALLMFRGGGTARWALNRLNYTYERAVGEARFIEAMQRKSWDLVVWDLPYESFTQRETTLKLLEDHVAAGGRMLVNYNNLDSWPGLQTLLGVEIAIEATRLQDVLPTIPRHASYPGGTIPWSLTLWNDWGDSLVPSASGISVGLFKDGSVSMVLGNEGRTLVNGFDWDTHLSPVWAPERQIKYIMGCRADLDVSTGSEVLDIFDFLEFQDLFIKQDPLANMDFNANFDIFDFLAFQAAFVNGCK